MDLDFQKINKKIAINNLFRILNLTNEFFNFKFFSILIISFPIFLISGPFIPELILGFASIYINFLIIKNKDFYYYKNKYTYFFDTMDLSII